MKDLIFEELVDRKFSLEEIQETLIDNSPEHLYESLLEREVIVSNLVNSYGTVGTVVISLEGSPAKAYAVYIPEYRMISFFDNEMNKFGEYYAVHGIDGLE